MVTYNKSEATDSITYVVFLRLGQTYKESIADKVLTSCETVQVAVTAMLESYNKSTENNTAGIIKQTWFIYSIVIPVQIMNICIYFLFCISRC